MPVETRYMRGDQHTVNGLTAYILGTTQSDVEQVHKRGFSGNVGIEWGIRVWKRKSDGTEEEITNGTPVAIVSRGADGEGIQSATWTCPQTSLSSTDAIVVRVYVRELGGSWYLHAEFITEQLGASSLDGATWTVYYYTYRRYNALFDITDAWFYWGTTDKNSRIENFSWSVGGVAHEVEVTDSTLVSDAVSRGISKSFTDTGVSSDFLRRGVGVSLRDSSIVSDVVSKRMKKNFVDLGKGVDFIAKGLTVSLKECSFLDFTFETTLGKFLEVTEVVYVHEYLRKDSEKVVADLGMVSDYLGKATVKVFTDSSIVSDRILREVVRCFVDSVVSSDYVQREVSKSILDLSRVSDWIGKGLAKVLVDSEVTVDWISKAISRSFIDSSKSYDYVSKASIKSLKDVGRGIDRISKSVGVSRLDTVLVSDWVSRDMVYSLLDSISVADYVRREFGKSFRDYVVGECVITKTAILHRSYADVVKSVDFVSKGLFIPLKDTVIGSDYLMKEISRVVSDVARVLDWIGRRYAVTVSDLVKGLDYVSKDIAFSVSDLAKAIDWIVVPTVKLIVVKDVVFPDFSTAKGVEKPFREVISVIDLKAVKDIAKRFVDYVIVRDQAIRTRIIEVFDRVIADFEVVKDISSVIKEVVKSVDVITKLRYTLTGIDVRRVYFHKYLGDIIEDTDEINRVDSSKNLLNMIKSLASKMGVADDPYISQDISKLEEIVGTMEYVKNGEYVYAEHVNVFVDYMTYAIDVVELLYDKWKSAKGTSLPEVEYWLEMAKARKDLMRTVKFGDIVLTRDHNLIIDTLKPLECSIRVMDREW